MSTSRIERLLSLINLFMGAERPVRVEQVRQLVPGYPEEHASFQRQFERDKAELRTMGLPLETIELDDYPPVFGYRIPRERAHLRDPGLGPEELAALALAASAVRLDGIEGSGGLWKLGGEQADGSGEGLAGLPAGDKLVVLFEAVTERRQATFAYRDLDRTVDPWRLGCTRGRWYLTGHDHTRGDSRHFRVDRIGADLTTGPPDAFTRPTGAIEGVRMEAWQFGPGPARPARLLVDASHVGPALSTAPGAVVVEERDDGSAVLELQVTDVGAFRSFVIGFLEHAEVLDPPDLRAAVVDWLSGIVAGRGAAVRLSTAEKLQRLISIVAWINGREDGATLDEVCTRFDISRGELVAQLEMANMIGAESEDYTDMPVDVTFEGDVVRVFLMEFHRPLTLTPAQGLALVAAGAGSAALPGADPDGPLPRALAKLAGVLGIDPGETIDVDLGDADPAVLDQLHRAVEATLQVEVDYWSAGRDDQTHRVVDPWRVFSDEGAWYVQGHCHRAGGERVFRVDRIQALTVLDETFERPGRLPDAVAYRAGAEDPRVVLELGPEVRWVATTYPVDASEELGEGRLRVTMPAGAPAFLARLLLRLGPDARVVEIDERSGGPSAAADAARRVLARYGAEGRIGGRGDRR